MGIYLKLYFRLPLFRYLDDSLYSHLILRWMETRINLLRVQYVKDLLLHRVKQCGEYRIRTDDLLHAMQAL